jgi:hypothetical protein
MELPFPADRFDAVAMAHGTSFEPMDTHQYRPPHAFRRKNR